VDRENSLPAQVAGPQDLAWALQSLPMPVAVVRADGSITHANRAWNRGPAVGAGGALLLPVGVNCLDALLERAGQESGQTFAGIARGMRAVLAGEAATFAGEYTGNQQGCRRSFLLEVTGHASSDGVQAVVTHVDVKQRRRTAREVARLAMEQEGRERLLATVLSSTTDLTYATDREGRLIYANEPVLQVWGRTLQDVLGKTVHDLGYPPDLASTIQQQIARVFATGERITAETPFQGADGTMRFYEYIFSPAFAADGQVEFLVGVTRDITQHRRSEEALKDSISEFRALSSSMPQIVWVLDPEGKCTYLNPRWTDYTGRPLSQSMGSGWLAAFHPEDRPRVARALDRLPAADSHSMEARLARADGSYGWWLLRAIAMRDDAGKIVKWIGTSTDIDEIKAAESKLSEANRQLERHRRELRYVFDMVPAFLWLKDTAGRVLHINRRAADLVGCTVEEAVGKSIAEMFPGQAAQYEAEDREMAATGVAMSDMEQEHGPDGAVRWFQRDKVPCFDGEARVVAFMVMKQDVTDRKRDQDELRSLNAKLEARVRDRTAELVAAHDEADKANKAKSAFLAAMSHEIRTPMSGLLGLLELLELSGLQPEQRSTLHVARESGKALNLIIDGLLDFAKVEADSVELNLAPGSVRGVVHNVSQLHAAVALNKGLALHVHVDEALHPMHRFDALRVGQVLNNLLSNAVKFTDRGSVSVAVAVTEQATPGEYVRITVRDTGIGIAPEQLGRLFRPFAQADGQTFRQYGGTGLGLFIARRLVELMDGELRVESEPGFGTAFTVGLPLETCEEGSQPEATGKVSSGRLNVLVANRPHAPTLAQAEAAGTLLLVVDDHPVNRMVLLRQVATLGYAAEAAADGVQGLKAWESGRFGAVVTDCSMPRMDGFELARRIRAAEAATGAMRNPIVGCTANASASARNACLAAGMDDVLTKPVTLEDLSETLDWYLPLPEPSGVRAAATDADADALLDLEAASRYADDGPDGVANVLLAFSATNAADADELRRAVSARDCAAAIRLAHRIRGACSMLGADSLGEASSELEKAARQGTAADLDAALAVFERELARLGTHLSALC
jgi:PAS domain S-box-containing protein